MECFGLLNHLLVSYSEFLRFSPSFRLFSFALTDKTFGVDSEAIESIDAHWDYE